jgi:lipoyl(octanoyl) transferase
MRPYNINIGQMQSATIIDNVISNAIEIMDLGKCSYADAWDYQRDIHEKRKLQTVRDTLILVEHEPVYTLGKNADEDHILQHIPKGVKTFRIERGGDVTYHGPGQIVGYPILDLRDYRTSVSWYMRQLEEVIILTLKEFDINSERKDGLTGVWVGDEKIAALGVKISRWVTMHGFALNVNTDLSFYKGIIPCGIIDYGVTSMAAILRQPVEFENVKIMITNIFQKHFLSKQLSDN